jgi:p-aminobenzoyl-glutamate transporter AbgT
MSGAPPALEHVMSANAKKSMSATVTLILFGMLALFTGEKWLVVLIPAAALVWYGAASKLRSGRN